MEEIIEIMADAEHKRWASWHTHVLDCAIKSGDDSVGIRTLGFPTGQYENWERQVETDYADLTEKEKESDRREVRNTLDALKKAGYAIVPLATNSNK